MASSEVQSGTPAPYGRACTNCSRAKSKCILLPTGTGCERCQRLNKDCRPSPSVRKRNARPAASKAAQLEAKLDSIVSLLRTSGGSSSLPADWEATTPKARTANSPMPCNTGSPFTYAAHAIPSPMPSEASMRDSSLITETCDALSISPEMAEKLLIQFRTQNLRFLPFAHIPPHMTSQQLRNERPFFWLCIMAVLSPDNPAREALFNKITDIIHRELLVALAPSIDILLGVMTFMSWTTYAKRPFLIFYSHILMGLVCDLGIHQVIPSEHTTLQTFKSAVGWRHPATTTRTTEERRAVLGCFLITSCIAMTVCRIDALRWTPHMEESLSVLLDTKECPEDERLITLVKIQLVLDKVHQARRDGDNQSASPQYTKSFQSQLEFVKSQIPQHLQQDYAILMHLANAELTIHEVALRPPTLLHSPDVHRLESLCISLRASKSWLEHWIILSPERYMGLPFTMFFQFARALVNLYKLSTLDDPAWDRNMVKNTANVLEILDRIQYNLKRCADENRVADEVEYNIYEKGIKMMQAIKASWEPRLMEIWFPSLPSNGIDSQFAPTASPMPDILPVNGFDEAWLMEVFGAT